MGEVSWWRSRVGWFTTAEVVVGAAVIGLVVFVNQVLVGDQGNTWGGLISAAMMPAALAVAAMRYFSPPPPPPR